MNGVSNHPRRWATSAAAIAITNPIATAISVSLMCWSSAGWNVSPQWSWNQSQQKVRFSRTQLPPPPKSGITGPDWAKTEVMATSGRRDRVHGGQADRLALRVGGHERLVAMGEHDRQGVAQARLTGARGPLAPLVIGSSSRSSSVASDRRFRPRSLPTKRATNSLAGSARIWSGVSYCASRPPSARMAMRSPILIASSMSWVTKMTVLRISRWRRRNSSCSRSRVIGSIAPNGSSMSMSGGSAASARASPTRWRWPPESCAG